MMSSKGCPNKTLYTVGNPWNIFVLMLGPWFSFSANWISLETKFVQGNSLKNIFIPRTLKKTKFRNGKLKVTKLVGENKETDLKERSPMENKFHALGSQWKLKSLTYSN